ncbi:serine/threonine-protein phosphatase 7 long form homolog [Abrus precatorius]|uniref:Serine/threonine-protein phosphatase 7 long form homolog n=1 Tax=Abrus precatorius TaxID=3816 RepID=A0A8B8LQP8_ABRPR|nr:serine/threonine-protein phosphatase 7 long form homolog [Abrus precatorius]
MEGVLIEIIPHLTVARFAGVAQLASISIDRQLIIALMGLRIDGRPVIAPTGGDRAQIVEDLLGIRPPSRFMLADHSSSRVPVRYLPLLEDLKITGQYSWGAAALAFLYRELCMSINIDRSGVGGLTPLVMMWVWDRFPFLAPGDPPYTQNDLPYGAWLTKLEGFTTLPKRPK